MQLRGYRKGDVDAMYRLDVACFETPFRFSRTAMRRFAEADHARVTVAEVGGAFAGFGILHLEWVEREPVGYIVTLDVAVEHRQTGVGRVLMGAMESQARAGGCSTMVLHVFCGNLVAIAFYERCGFERSGIEPGFYGRGLDAEIWVKRLPG